MCVNNTTPRPQKEKLSKMIPEMHQCPQIPNILVSCHSAQSWVVDVENHFVYRVPQLEWTASGGEWVVAVDVVVVQWNCYPLAVGGCSGWL